MKYFVFLFFILFALSSSAHAAPLQHPVIHISKAQYLTTDKKLIIDITKQVKTKDNSWATVHNGEYIRVTFEKTLDRNYDNAIYARPTINNVIPAKAGIQNSIEVYPVYTDVQGNKIEFPSIGSFSNINHEGFFKVLLNQLQIPTNTFDYKVTGNVDIDYIVDPTFTLLRSLGTVNYGSNPNGTLILSGNTLYGMTPSGGAYGDGIIFSVNTDGSSFKILHNFSGSTTDGEGDSFALILFRRTLYGTASQGGAHGEGIIFSIAIDGNSFTDLHDFSGSTTDGAFPSGSVILSAGTLYGMTGNGGADNDGIIFSMAITGGPLTDLHDFSGSSTDGADPVGNLDISGSTLYGMAEEGGANNEGIIFSIGTNGSGFTDLHDFSGSSTDGEFPDNSLILPGSGYSYSRSITVQSSQISGGADLTQFPILVCGNASSGACNTSVSNMATVSNGGHVQNSNGYDIIFTTDSACTNQLTWEMKNYNASTGEFEAWVTNASTPLSHSSNTTFYMCYGNSSISTFQSTASSVWDSNYSGVWHLSNGVTLNRNDSTSNANNATSSGGSAATGWIDGGASFSGGGFSVSNSNFPTGAGSFTTSVWAKASSITSSQYFIFSDGTNSNNESNGFGFFGNGSTQQLCWSSWNPTLCGTTNLSANTWYYFVITYDGSTVTLYINGAYENSGSFSPSVTGSFASIGSWTCGTSCGGMNGSLDEIRVSKTNRSAGWITTEYNNQSAPSSFYTMGSETIPTTPSTLYGMTYFGGANSQGLIFSMATNGGSFTDLHDFNASSTDGGYPTGELTFSGNALYGMTEGGGANADGLIFSIATTGGTLTDLHDFSGSSTDGKYPYASLISSGNTLYGTAEYGGATSNGIVFSIPTGGGSMSDLHDFSGAMDAEKPIGTLIRSGGMLYGMSQQGGPYAGSYGPYYYSKGVIFSIGIDGSDFTILHEFTGSSTDGEYPQGSLVLSGSILYGMTELGGANSNGIIFSISTSGRSFTDLHDFSGGSTDGSEPRGSLILSGNTLYGMSASGGANGDGIIFSMLTSGGSFTDLHDFAGGPTDGVGPYGSLTLSGSTLYGMAFGGANYQGMIFSVTTTGGSYTDLHDFSGSTTDGAYPYGSLIVSGGTLYGMAYYGGANNEGLIFSIATTGGALTDLHDFSGSSTDGEYPYGSLTLFGSTLYGMTPYGGANDEGLIFSIPTGGGALTDLHDFDGSDGASPDGDLTI